MQNILFSKPGTSPRKFLENGIPFSRNFLGDVSPSGVKVFGHPPCKFLENGIPFSRNLPGHVPLECENARA